MIYTNQTAAHIETGISYLGSVNLTTKHKKAYKFGEMTYSLYLSPAKTSGYEVCPGRTKECSLLCLNESGMNTMNMSGDIINNSRIKKTKLFFEHHDYFMWWLLDEINCAKNKADKLGYTFSVRLNNTSDISPENFSLEMNSRQVSILEMFPDCMFYEYTKVPDRIDLMKKYKNYDVTFSYSGENMTECLLMLTKGIKVAVVFKNKLPEQYWGYKVINGDLYDMRYKDEKGVIVGLKYKRVRAKPDINSKFVVIPA